MVDSYYNPYFSWAWFVSKARDFEYHSYDVKYSLTGSFLKHHISKNVFCNVKLILYLERADS